MAKSYEELIAQIEKVQVMVQERSDYLESLGGVYKEMGQITYPPLLEMLTICKDSVQWTQDELRRAHQEMSSRTDPRLWGGM